VLTARPALAATAHNAVVRSGLIYDTGPYPQVHASTLVETSGGELLAAWFGGTAESNPDVCIWLSRFEGGRWTPGMRVADGIQHAGKRYPTWNPVLFQPVNGPLMLFYKVGPTPETTAVALGARRNVCPRMCWVRSKTNRSNSPMVQS
jgi:predicted neuraminidase